MKNFCLDIGNTRAKTAIFDQQKLEHFQYYDTEDALILPQKLDSIIYAKVKTLPQHWYEAIQKYQQKYPNTKIITLDARTPIPIHNRYKTPHTLGTDRLAAAVGAYALYPQKNTLIIDAGTCITYDFIDQKGQFWGGNISLGLQMRAKALHQFTEKLPEITINTNSPPHNLIGTYTEEALINGIVGGILAEIETTIQQYKAIFPNITIIICGGDAFYLEKKIKSTIFALPNLILHGLNSIAHYNASLP
ncbi:MAG: type III pantothenate kinase [Cytophagales bacterium]|nr:MAG: type III pantothenate kinase [Cytophagales bacterium]